MKEESTNSAKTADKIPPRGAVKILHKVMKHADLCELNPILGNGEICIVIFDDGTRSFKIGDGITYYNQLAFFDQPVKNKYNRALKKVTNILIATSLIKVFFYFYGHTDFDNLVLIYSIITMAEILLVKWGGRYK